MTVESLPAAALPSHAPPGIALLVFVGAVAYALRRRLPPGFGAGWFIAAVSGAAIVIAAAFGSGAADARPRHAWVFAPLALGWFLAGRVRPEERLFSAAALAFGLLSAGGWLALGIEGIRAHAGAALFDLCTLLSVAVAAAVLAQRAAGTYCAAAALGLIAFVLLPWDDVDRLRSTLVPAQPGLAAAGLALLLISVLWDWSLRRAAWQADPRRVATPPEGPPILSTAAVLLAVLAALCALAAPQGVASPLGAWLAALAVLGAAHRRGWRAVGDVGLLMIGAGIVLAGATWIGGPAGVATGVVVAGAFLLWLSRFWSQQLLEGEPWTTTGALVPRAERAACAAAGGAFALTAGGLVSPGAASPGATALAVVGILLLGFGLLLLRAAQDSRRPGPDLAACLAAFAAAECLRRFVTMTAGVELTAAASVAAVGSILALRVASPLGRAVPGEGLTGFVCGAIPVWALLQLTVAGFDAQAATALVLACGALATLLLSFAAAVDRAAAPASHRPT